MAWPLLMAELFARHRNRAGLFPAQAARSVIGLEGAIRTSKAQIGLGTDLTVAEWRLVARGGHNQGHLTIGFPWLHVAAKAFKFSWRDDYPSSRCGLESTSARGSEGPRANYHEQQKRGNEAPESCSSSWL